MQDEKLIPYHKHIKVMMESFYSIELEHISRTDNQITDALTTLSSMHMLGDQDIIPQIQIQKQEDPSYVASVEEESDDKPWYHDIKPTSKAKDTHHGHQKMTKGLFGDSLQGSTLMDRPSINETMILPSFDTQTLKKHDTYLRRCTRVFVAFTLVDVPWPKRSYELDII